jgi:hypothetical protein
MKVSVGFRGGGNTGDRGLPRLGALVVVMQLRSEGSSSWAASRRMDIIICLYRS